MKSNQVIIGGAFLAFWIFPTAIPRTQAAVIDFEDFNLGGLESVLVASPQQFPNADGSGTRLTIAQGAQLRLYDLRLFTGSSQFTGQVLMDWSSPGGNTTGTTMSFDDR